MAALYCVMVRSLLLLAAAASPVAAQSIDSTALMRHVRVLAHDSLEGRRIGTPGNAKARAYVIRAFGEAGLQPIGGSLELPFQYSARDSSRHTGVNIAGVVRGSASPDRYIVVSAHYDHLGYSRAVGGDSLYNGADDNASGTGAVIELARWFARNRPRHSIIFVALDGEEGGLRGARAFVAQPPVPIAQIALNVNLDMVGRNASNVLYAAGAHPWPFLRPYLDSVVTGAPVTLRLGHDRPGVQGEDDWTFQSDQGPFHQAGIPFVYFGEEDHPDYHRPSDHAERLIPGFYAGAATVVLRTILIMDRNLQHFPSR